MSYVGTGRGLGALSLAYCQSLGFFDFVGSPGCWGWGVPNAIAYAGYPSTPPPVTVLPPPSNVPPSSGAEAQAAVDAATAANVAANQAAMQSFFGNVGQNAGDVSAGVNWGLLLLVGVVGVVGAMFITELSRPSPYVR